MGKFIITKRKDNEFQFNLKATNGQVILTSEGYTAKASCTKGIESVKTNALSESRYERKIARNGLYYFNLKAGNGEVIGTSQMYTTFTARDNGIESVMVNAPGATILDETT